MKRMKRMRVGIAAAMFLLVLFLLNYSAPTAQAGSQEPTPGSLQILGKEGAFCPLKHTDVQAEFSGAIGRVTVTQEFVNTSADKIEAVYVFPRRRTR